MPNHRNTLWAPLWIILTVVVLSGCAPRPSLGSEVPAQDPAELVIDLPALVIDINSEDSPSTLARLAEAAGSERASLLKALTRSSLIAIGRVTARALESERLPVAGVATEPSDDGIANTLLRVLST